MAPSSQQAIDWAQWRALCRAYVLIDYGALLKRRSGADTRRRTARNASGIFIGLVVLGGPGAMAVWLQQDLFLGALVVATITISLVGSVVLTQSSLILAPDDAGVLGFRPVNSRTYFAVRVTAVLIQTAEIAALSGVLPLLAFVTRGASPLVILGAAFTVAGSALFTTLFLISVHAFVLQYVRPRRLSKWLGGLQLLLTVVYTASMFFSMALAVAATGMFDTVFGGTFRLGSVVDTLASPTGLRWYPGAWFASYVALADGQTGHSTQFAALTSLVALIAVASLLSGSVATEYAIRQRDSMADASERESARYRLPKFVRGERRAMLLLAWGEMRSSSQLRHGIFAAVTIGAIGLVYVLTSHTHLSLGDPSARPGILALQVSVAAVAIRILQALRISEADRSASWLFLISPADRVQLITAGRDLVTVFVLLPALLVVSVILLPLVGSLSLAVLYAATLGSLSFVMLQMTILATPVVPFSTSTEGVTTGKGRVVSFLPWIVGMVLSTVVWTACSTPQLLAFAALATTALAIALGRLSPRWLLARTAA